jgi:hypothetical protein
MSTSLIKKESFEHKGLARKVEAYKSIHKKLPSDRIVAGWIVSDHKRLKD